MNPLIYCMAQTILNERKLDLESQKIRSILESINELSQEEQKAKKSELEKIRKEKGEKAVQDFLLKQFKLN